MGKNDNIKRAKRLKESKRKREQEALIARRFDQTSNELKRRNSNTGIESHLNADTIQYSELLSEFIKPILSETDDFAIIRTKYIFGAKVWNAATLRYKSEEVYQSVKKDIAKAMSNNPLLGQLFEEFAKRKIDEFFEFKSIIVEIEFKEVRKQRYFLKVTTAPIIDL